MNVLARSVRRFGSVDVAAPEMLTIQCCESSAVAGDHTRTVTIIAPTSGGLMSFAVKRVTCLGCKTPLKPNALSELLRSRRVTIVRAAAHPSIPINRSSSLQQLSTKDGRTSRSAGRAHLPSRDCLRALVDAVPALPGFSAPGELGTMTATACRSLLRLTTFAPRTGCPLHVEGLPDLLHAQEGANGSRRLGRHSSAL